MTWVVAGAWGSSRDYDKTRGCHNTEYGNVQDPWYGHCKGDFPIESWKRRGRRTRFGCVNACGNKIQYRPGVNGHPCSGAAEIKGIPVNISLQDKSGIKGAIGNPQGAFWCRFDINGAKLKSYSGDTRMTSAGDGSRSIYEQLLFGANKGSSYRSEGFCAKIQNLNTVVHNDGRTCYGMISNAADKKTKGILYCQSNRTDPKCKCVNVTGNNFLQTCEQNPTWAGCNEVLKGQDDLKKIGLTSASGLYGNADCLAPGICSGDVYEPMTNLQACANKNAVCNQILKLDNITAYADMKTAQSCNINFEAEQKKKDDAKKAAAAAAARPSPSPAAAKLAADKAAADKAAAAKLAADKAAAKAKAAGASPAEVQAAADKAAADIESKPIEDFVKPTGFGGFSTTQLAIGGGGAFLLCCCCLIILILATSGGGNGGGPGRFRR